MKFQVMIMVSWETKSGGYWIIKMEGYPKVDCGSVTNKCDGAGTIKGSYACFCQKEYFTSQDK